MSKVDVLLGLQWGDEGKGKVVDFLAPKYNIVARFQGGPNAGHTLEFEGKKHVLHQIPSGIFRPDILNIMGNGVVVDPVVFKREIEALKPYDVNPLESLVLSNKAQIIIPTHKLLDKALEQQKGDSKIGSTLRGIGPTYQDKTGRNGLRIGDVLESDFEHKYDELKTHHIAMLDNLGFHENLDAIEDDFFESLDLIRKFGIRNTEYLINDALVQGQNVLAEGAQGTLLDIDFGSYPFVTSSNTTTAGACTGLGIAPNKIKEVFGIFKAYCSRVGSGPFPTELQNKEGEELRKLGNEFGATTGRPRRCGWLDLPALKYSCMLNGVTELYMMKADVLSGMKQIKFCDTYQVNRTKTQEFPFNQSTNCSPIYKKQPGWIVNNISQEEDLPNSLLQFVEIIENYTSVKVRMISLGPDREESVMIKK